MSAWLDMGAVDPRMKAAPGSRVWVVVLVARPPGFARSLREVLRALGEEGAYPLSSDVVLVPDGEGAGNRLRTLADRVFEAGGRVILADSVIVAAPPRSGDHAR